MMNELNNDRPITSLKEDRFSRADFAKKIASLCSSKTPESRVIGLYGKWGDGKSSLLNMVSDSLDKEVIKINFNPWFFKDENELLMSFFRLFADKLGGSLEFKNEKIREAIVEYGEVVGVFGAIPGAGSSVNAGKGLLRFFKKPKPLSTETAKQRVIDLIISSKANIAVFIDDIDRLDCREVTAVFKLVKLLADFPRTTYLLSFDQEVVAKMLAPQYGGTEIEFGYQYLEKVIQLPLAIPMAHTDEIMQFLNSSILKISVDNKLNLDNDKEKLAEYYADGLVTLLDNPRKIIRFCNSLRFAVPILRGEVNIYDLTVIEAFKITAPGFYFFIRQQKHLMTDNYLEQAPDHAAKRDYAKKQVNPTIANFPQYYKEALRELTCRLFPRFAWQDPAEAKGFNDEQLGLSRCICIPEFYDRYFTFSLMANEISDVHFTATYLDQHNFSEEAILKELQADIQKYSFENVAFKLARHRHTIKGEHAEKLIHVLSKSSDQFEEADWSLGSPYKMMVIAVEAMIKNLPKDKQSKMVEEVAAASASMNFAADVVARFVMHISSENPSIYFPEKLAKGVKELYVKRLKEKVDELGFFNAVPQARMARQLVWWHDVDPEGLRHAVDHVFISIHGASILFMRIFTPTVTVMDEKGATKEIKANLQEEQFFLMDRIIGVDKVMRNLNYTHFQALENYDWSKRPGLNDEIDDEEMVRLYSFFQRMKADY